MIGAAENARVAWLHLLASCRPLTETERLRFKGLDALARVAAKERQSVSQSPAFPSESGNPKGSGS